VLLPGRRWPTKGLDARPVDARWGLPRTSAPAMGVRCLVRMNSRQRQNLDPSTVEAFGLEWSRFDQSELDADELKRLFDAYFRVFPWKLLPPGGGIGADIGCGSGRWSRFVAPRCAHLHLVDASPRALEVARVNLRAWNNLSFHVASIDRLPFPDNSLDFAFSLGVLHHVPDTAAAIDALAYKLKPGAPLLLYLYYAMENRPRWYRITWRATDLLRELVCRMPSKARNLICDGIAAGVYLPLARTAATLRRVGLEPAHWPLRQYAQMPFYVMRNDALDRFGTPLERRFTRPHIESMLTAAGFKQVCFSDSPPYWCAVGVKMPR
jgi:SAM-dependent methyltransferase